MRRWVGAYRAQERSDLACPACAACGVRDPHLAYSERGPLRDLPARHWMRTIRTLHHAGDDGHVDSIGTRLPVVLLIWHPLNYTGETNAAASHEEPAQPPTGRRTR